MNTVSDRNFGLLIAYLVPGFTALLGVSYFSPTVASWLNGANADGPTIGGFLYVTLAAVAAGMTVSTVRWVLIDSLHHATGIKKPKWDFTKLQQHFNTYDRLESNHYRYYQFYSAMVIAIPFAWMAWRINNGLFQAPRLIDLVVILLTSIFFAGSRDTLAKYYDRVTNLLCVDAKIDSNIPSNEAAKIKSERGVSS